MSLVALAAVISLDVTRELVNAGLGFGFDGDRYTRTGNPAALTITGATNTTPIVITTARPHKLSTLKSAACLGGASVIVSGVLGNTASNNVSTAANDRTIGQNQGVFAVPLTETTAALYRQSITDPTALEPIPGNGVYTSGGTLAPALTDGGILLGREHTAHEYSAPPRIVLVPTSFAFAARSVSIPSGSRTGDITAQKQKRPIRTERVSFEVQVWGQAAPPHPARDFDATRLIAHRLIDSIHLLFPGAYEVTGGTWADQAPGATQLLKAGHLIVFGVTINTPVTDEAADFATGITVEATGRMDLTSSGGTIDIGCQGGLT